MSSKVYISLRSEIPKVYIKTENIIRYKGKTSKNCKINLKKRNELKKKRKNIVNQEEKKVGTSFAH